MFRPSLWHGCRIELKNLLLLHKTVTKSRIYNWIRRVAHLVLMPDTLKRLPLFIDRTDENPDINGENNYPKLPKSMRNEIRKGLNFSIDELIREILDKY